jgi:hypothetical protein
VRFISRFKSKTAAPLASAGGAAVLVSTSVPPRGVEGTTDSSEKHGNSTGSGADSGAVGEGTAELVSLLAALTPAQRAVLLAIMRATN